jgi:putative ABC transport system substrate-binding protein
MQRRDFITLLSGLAAWPLTARAQQGERMRRIGVLIGADENDPVWKTRVAASLEMAARSLKVVPIIAPVHSDIEIETAIVTLGRDPGGGLVVMTDSSMNVHRSSIISAAARNSIPAVYFQSVFARDGGLLSYGIDQVDNWRRAASYVDSVLRGAKPGDLPVQFPVKYELVLNLKTAKTLGLTVPPTLLVLADEVIE